MAAVWSGSVTERTQFSESPRTFKSPEVVPIFGDEETVTTLRMVAFPQPRAIRAHCAGRMPMKASGAASARQGPRFLRPRPGSTSTGTAPALKRAKVSSKKSRPGRTIRTVRTPGPIPILCRPAARRSLSRSSWRKVRWTCLARPVRSRPAGARAARASGRWSAIEVSPLAMLASAPTVIRPPGGPGSSRGRLESGG
jgi:hypothetical protein